MSAQLKKAQQLARQLFKLSVVDGLVSAEHVAGVLQYVEKARPANALLVLQAYHRLVAHELAKGQALVEHAGPLDPSVLASIATSMSARYGRRITATAKSNPALLAGLRVRVGDDVYENSAAGRLDAFAALA